MSKKVNTNSMDDVDRLFQCFKCGISPPPSAMRERKRSKNKLKQENMTSGVRFSAGSAAEELGNSIDKHLGRENSCSTTVSAKIFSRGKQISPVVFYGSPHGVPPKRPLSLLRLLHEIRIDLSEQRKSNFRKGVWTTFPRQDEAMKFAKGHEHLHVFSYQDHFSGQRRYLVSTYEEFWTRYKNMDPKHRHHYEVIQEGFPCHLYFDLEFNKRENVGKNGDEMVDIFISVILKAFHEKYSIEENQDCVVELDSSTKDKFSRHLIIRIPRTAFRDNSHVGVFVAEICSRIANARENDRSLEKLFIQKESNASASSSQLFVDTAVYSRNRLFRLALSSKAGKTSVLLPTGRFRCKSMNEEDMFMQSLICNMDLDCEKLLICKTELGCMKTLCFDTEPNDNARRYQSGSQKFQLDSFSRNTSAPNYVGKSPFPDLDKFIESIASIGNVSGKIRCWYWFSEDGLIVYSMSRNRYCERMGRQHKSNHVMYVVDLRRAVYYQKCYDPDCRGYRSPLRPVPEDSIPEEMVYLGGFVNTHIGDQFDNEYQMGDFDNNEDNVESASQDSWWVEAIKVADDLENKPKTLELSNMETHEEDDWWVAAERSVSQTEIGWMHCPSSSIE